MTVPLFQPHHFIFVVAVTPISFRPLQCNVLIESQAQRDFQVIQRDFQVHISGLSYSCEERFTHLNSQYCECLSDLWHLAM